MMKPVNIALVGLVCLLNTFATVDSAEGSSKSKEEIPLKVFYHQEDEAGWRTIVKGKITSIGTVEEMDKGSISEMSKDKTKVGVRLYSSDGINKNDILYVINEKNLIVAKMTVQSVFNSLSFGPMLVGYGNFRLAKLGNRVVMREDDENSKYAYIYTSRGNYYRRTGDEAQSINNYKKAIEIDRGNPEAHFELGRIYLDDGILQLAFIEFSESYKNIARMYDREDRFQLLRYMVLTRMKQAYETRLPKNLREKFINEGLKYAKEALAMKPDDAEINYCMGVLFFRNPNPSDRDSRNYLLKTIEKDPDNVNAYVILSELYYRHKNMEKSRTYAESALKIDPNNERARYIRTLTEEKD